MFLKPERACTPMMALGTGALAEKLAGPLRGAPFWEAVASLGRSDQNSSTGQGYVCNMGSNQSRNQCQPELALAEPATCGALGCNNSFQVGN